MSVDNLQIPRLWIPDSTSTDSGFHKWLDSRFWILDSISWITDSTDQNYLDSEFNLTWGDLWTVNSEVVLSVISASKTINIDKILRKNIEFHIVI